MTHKNDSIALTEAMEQVIEHGFNGLGEALTILLNEAMNIERSRTLQATLCERSMQRLGYANGYKSKSLDTRLGRLQLSIPQVRGDVSFYPSALEKGLCSERALLPTWPRCASRVSRRARYRQCDKSYAVLR